MVCASVITGLSIAGRIISSLSKFTLLAVQSEELVASKSILTLYSPLSFSVALRIDKVAEFVPE